MKKSLASLLFLVALLLLSGCASVKKVPYFQNIDQVDLAASKDLYNAHIMPKDLLTISVNTINPTVSAPFNLSTTASSGASSTAQGYLVDNAGNIKFTVLGKIHVAGIKKEPCEELIKNQLTPYI